ncbi:MAG: LysE family translocator [Bacteroidetes bacterium]|nr:LysE family translocator [Bacteroidota bacterium]
MMEYLNPIIGGSLAGLLIAVMLGPVFFVLLQTSLKRGFKSAVFFALGIVTSDTMFTGIAYIGVSSFLNPVKAKPWMTLIGGGFMVFYGIFMFFKKKQIEGAVPKESSTEPLKNFFAGWFFNSINPTAFFYWVVVVTAVTGKYEGNPNQIFIFFVACMGMVFGTDILKAYLADRLKTIVTPTVLHRINQISGLVLFCAGSKLLFDAYKMFFT